MWIIKIRFVNAEERNYKYRKYKNKNSNRIRYSITWCYSWNQWRPFFISLYCPSPALSSNYLVWKVRKKTLRFGLHWTGPILFYRELAYLRQCWNPENMQIRTQNKQSCTNIQVVLPEKNQNRHNYSKSYTYRKFK